MMKHLSGLSNAMIASIIFAGSFVFLAVAMDRTIGIYDESLILVGATRVADGAIPHRDFFANCGPAQFYALAGLFNVFGTSVLVERAWDTAIRAALVTVAFFILQRAVSRREGCVAAGLVLIWVCVFGFYAFPVFPSELFALLGVLCLSPVFEDHRSVSLLFASGICLGITTLFRYDVGFYAFAALTLVSAVYVLSRPLPLCARLTVLLRVLLPCWLGLAIVCVPVAVAFAVGGVIHYFIFDDFYYPAHLYRRMRALPFPGLRMTLGAPIQIGIYLPVAVWITALAAVFYGRRSKSVAGGSVARPWIMLLLGVLSAMFYLKGLVRVSVIHMALSIVPALMLTATLLPYVRPAGGYRIARLPMIAALAGLVIVVLPTLFAIGNDGRAIVRNLVWGARPDTWTAATANTPTGLSTCCPEPGLERGACFTIDQARADAIRYIEANSRPNDPIFVGLHRHDRIFVNDMLFYFIAARKPATKWYHFDPGLQTTKEIQTEMIGELQTAKPRYVVLEAEWDDFAEPNESVVSSGVTLLDDFIRAHYRPVRTFGAITVLRAAEG
jgi:hypothetical protein